MNHAAPEDGIARRDFLRLLAVGGAAATVAPLKLGANPLAAHFSDDKPDTNIADALKHPRNASSMPGKYPGRVAQALDEKSIANGKPDPRVVSSMLEKSMLALTGAADVTAAWREFVTPDDIIGLKVNPVAGKELSTSLELTRAVIEQLERSGIPRRNIVLWDRREFEMHEVGYTPENFPGIRIVGTECKDEKGGFRDKEGNLYSEKRIDKDWFYWADCEDAYDADTLPYMVNEGKHSYFSNIVTKDVTKIINLPILKNAGPTVTLCLKNLAYGAITNTGRLHKKLWAETCAQVPCFPPLRDKVVLNIVDGIIGCYNGGPGANPQFITPFNTVLVGTDAVAVDRIGYDIILKKRLDQKVQKEESPKGIVFMTMAEGYKLGVADIAKIDLRKA